MTRICYGLLVLFPLLMTPMPSAYAERIVNPVDPGEDYPLSRPSAKVMRAILADMGMGYAPEDGGDGSDTPVPPKDAPTDDFFTDDDDFFSDEQSFDDITSDMDTAFDETVSDWDKDYEETVARWDEAREIFLGNKEQYEKGTIPIQPGKLEPVEPPKPKFAPRLADMAGGEYYLLPNALELAIKDQAGRGTCAAFAGVRALETLLVQHDVRADLSEEHYYFIAKPACQSSPCGRDEEGSTTFGGLRESSNPTVKALLRETTCPYTPMRDPKNITNAPLNTCYGSGVVRARKLYPMKQVGQVVTALRNNQPVVAGFTLTRSYYENRGVVRLHDPINARDAEGEDAGGHANLLVGYVKLPETMSNEGNFCLITANSWNLGWGRGGYACLTEAWLNANGGDYVGLTSMLVTDQGERVFGM